MPAGFFYFQFCFSVFPTTITLQMNYVTQNLQTYDNAKNINKIP